jgi:putative transposase
LLSEEQIIGILKTHEAGVSVADLLKRQRCRIYKWRAKFAGMEGASEMELNNWS